MQNLIRYIALIAVTALLITFTGPGVRAGEKEGPFAVAARAPISAMHIALNKKDWPAIRRLVTIRPALVDIMDRTKRTPLILALEAKQKDLAKFLIARGANLHDQFVNPVVLAVQQKDKKLLAFLLKQGADINALSCSTVYNPLHAAVLSGSKEFVEVLLASGAAVDAMNRNGRAALHMAARTNKIAIVRALLAAKANPNILGRASYTPVFLAAMHGHTQVLQLLMGHKEYRPFGGTAIRLLSEAARGGYHQLVPIILKHCTLEGRHEAAAWAAVRVSVLRGSLAFAEAMLKGGLRQTAGGPGGTNLHWAAGNLGNKALVALLLKYNISPHARDKDGRTPLYAAALGKGKDQKEIVAMLLAKGARVDSFTARKDTPLWAAMLHPYTGVAQLLIERGADVNVRGLHGASPLHLAVRAGDKKLTELLLKKGASLEAWDRNGDRPLHWVASRAPYQGQFLLRGERGEPKVSLEVRAAILKILLDHARDVAPASGKRNYMTPLHIVDFAAGAALLLDYKAPVDIVDGRGQTPLIEAVRYNRAGVVGHLLVHGADPNIKMAEGGSPLWFAIFNRKLETVKLLLLHKADPNSGPDRYGRTPLLTALGLPQDDIAKLLLEYGADANKVGGSGGRPLDAAAQRKNEDLFEAILKRGASIDGQGANGETLLGFAAREGKREIAELALKHGAGIDVKGSNGRTPLHEAVVAGKHNMLLYLIKKGAAVKPKTSSFRLFQAAMDRFDLQSAALLQKVGFDVKARSPLGNTLLHEVIRPAGTRDTGDAHFVGFAYNAKHRAEFLKFFLAQGADPNAKGPKGVQPLHLAAGRRIGREMGLFADILLDFKADPNARSESGTTPLHWGATNPGGKIVLQLLLKRGADVHAQDKNGNTPLHSATRTNQVYNMPILLKAGANVTTKNNSGKTPRDYAKGRRAQEIYRKHESTKEGP